MECTIQTKRLETQYMLFRGDKSTYDYLQIFYRDTPGIDIVNG